LFRYPNSIILSRRGYKRLQYETPGFKMFLTSAMATSTILYIGFSFTDDYLNEFRAEVLKMLRPSPRLHVQFKVVLECLKLINKQGLLSHFYEKNVHDDHLLDLKMESSRCGEIKADIRAIGITESDLNQIEKYVKERVVASSRRSGHFEEADKLPPIAYAIIDSKSQQQITYFRRHEGVQIMTWKTDGWFGGLDTYLDGILRQTSRPFLWGSFLAKNVIDNKKVIITWDLNLGGEKKMVKWWLLKCLEFYSKASRHHKSLYQEAARRRENMLKTTPLNSDDVLSVSPGEQRRTKSGARELSMNDIVVPVANVEELKRALDDYKNRVACVICPFGLSQALEDEAKREDRDFLSIYDATRSDRYDQFMSADHIVRLVQKAMAEVPPRFQCPFIVYANLHKDKTAQSWRQECAMRCGAFGFAYKTDQLFELIKRITDVYLPV
jgi:hypothetical protein